MFFWFISILYLLKLPAPPRAALLVYIMVSILYIYIYIWLNTFATLRCPYKGMLVKKDSKKKHRNHVGFKGHTFRTANTSKTSTISYKINLIWIILVDWSQGSFKPFSFKLPWIHRRINSSWCITCPFAIGYGRQSSVDPPGVPWPTKWSANAQQWGGPLLFAISGLPRATDLTNSLKHTWGWNWDGS